MSEPTTLSRIQNMLHERLGGDPDTYTPEKHFIKNLNCDSLDSVEITMAIESEFDIQIDDAEAERLLTVGDLVKFIDEEQLRMAKKTL